MIELSSHEAFLSALIAAREVTCEAYILPPAVTAALETAAAHGAHVRVRLESSPFGGADWAAAAAAARRVADLRAHGVDAVLRDQSAGVVHSKVALVDGVAWLDDRNFPISGPDLIVRDNDPKDVAHIAHAMAGERVCDARVALDKVAALRSEARVLHEGAPATVDVSTESFGYGTIERVMRDAVARGAHVRLIVSARELAERKPQELAALHLLAGAEIRVRDDVDKLAVTPKRAWLGSANATGSYGKTDTQSDWGLSTGRRSTVTALEARFEAAWEKGAPYVAPSVNS